MFDQKRSLALLGGVLLGACGPSFLHAYTPSGEPCTDMPIIPLGGAVEKPYHRIRPVASSVKCTTEAERLESLRQEACKLRADAIIEAANEPGRTSDGGPTTRASGTAVVWKRAQVAPTPLNAPAPQPTLPDRKSEKPSSDKPSEKTEASKPDEDEKGEETAKSETPPPETPPPATKKKGKTK